MNNLLNHRLQQPTPGELFRAASPEARAEVIQAKDDLRGYLLRREQPPAHAIDRLIYALERVEEEAAKAGVAATKPQPAR